MNIDLKILEKYNNDGLLYKQRHPEHELLIWNYTPEVQFKKKWDDITTQCRGLVTGFDGNVVSWCLRKFFNIEELTDENIPTENFDVFEKMDGSYVSIFLYDNEVVYTSRASFSSDVAILAKKIIETKYKDKVTIYPNLTYIFELIGPDNRIVLEYPENDLVLLTIIDKERNEINIYDEPFNGFNRVIKYCGITDLKTIKKLISNDKEGFVIKYKSGFRLKIKGDEYFRLHSIITKISNRDIWEYLKNDKPLDDIVNNVPDEFYDWVTNQIESLKKMYDVTNRYVQIMFYGLIREDMTRKEAAEIINKKDKKIRSMLFNLYDKKDIKHLVWKHIYPKFSKPFANKI